LVRYSYNGSVLIDPLILLEIPANTGHNGSRLAIGTDGKVMWATGDVSCCATGDITDKKIAQDSLSYNGKILRMNIDGSIPSDNPFPGSPVWSLGFRVPQGLVYAANGLLYSAEHGDATDDELNIIQKGRNYGYPVVTGFCNEKVEKEFCASHAVVEPVKAWTPTIAPAGIDYYNSPEIPEWQNSILMVTLKTQTFRALKLNKAGTEILSEKIYFDKKFGRLRDICVFPSGDIYIATSNRDWNPAEGFPKQNDDRIIRLSKISNQKNPSKIISRNALPSSKSKSALPAGSLIYSNYCASCHKNNGEGVKGVFPPLKGNPTISGNKKYLVETLVNGLSGPLKVKGISYNQSMPSFHFLSDKDVADVLTYIRSNFGNRADKISSAEVSKIRKVKK
jgi:mono/diheme cytochrome c family protein